MSDKNKIHWLGSDDMSLDRVTLNQCGDICLGYYGGNTQSGQYKNEDGALILCSGDTTCKFALLLDSHTTNESAKLVLETIEKNQENLEQILDEPLKDIFMKLHTFFLNIFNSRDFKEKCRNVKGETACIIVVQKEQYLWWMSIGDNLVYLFHSELAELNQFSLNQRQFYEWVGKVNTFEAEVPCYSTGTRLLREGENYIYLLSDGVLECGSRPFENGKCLYELLTENKDISENISRVLGRVHEEKGRDNATIIGWSYFNNNAAPRPSR